MHNKQKSLYFLLYRFQEKELVSYGVWVFFIGTSLPPPCVNWLMEQPIGLDHHCEPRNLKRDYFKDTVCLIKAECSFQRCIQINSLKGHPLWTNVMVQPVSITLIPIGGIFPVIYIIRSSNTLGMISGIQKLVVTMPRVDIMTWAHFTLYWLPGDPCT